MRWPSPAAARSLVPFRRAVSPPREEGMRQYLVSIFERGGEVLLLNRRIFEANLAVGALTIPEVTPAAALPLSL